jgi:hypothetical protein
VVSLIIPSHASVYIYGFRFSAFRVVLFLTFIPVGISYIKYCQKILPDKLLLFSTVWMVASLIVNNGTKELAFALALFMETAIPYFCARVFVKSTSDYELVIRAVFATFIIVLIPVLYESYSGVNLFGVELNREKELRLGYYRASGPLDHPIVFGMYAASGISLLYALGSSSVVMYSIVLTLTFASLSSAAYLMLATQLALTLVKKLRSLKLSTYGLSICVLYLFISLLSKRSPLAVLASYISLDPATANFRIYIFEYAAKSVSNNIWFGIGLNDWERPEWMGSSIDSFLFVIAVRYGVIPLCLLALVIYYALKATYADTSSRLHTGFRALIISIVIASTTVHLWNALYVFFWVIIGMAVNLKELTVKPAVREVVF